MAGSSQFSLKGLGHWLNAKPDATPTNGRVEAIDLARGVAIALMILNHGISGLLSYDHMPEWALVPVHLVTRFSSSLFVMVFGIALAVAFLPHVGTEKWPRLRLKLLLTGVKVLFWYKLLTIVEMSQYAEPELIIQALLYQAFPSFVEILGFYAIALMWMPFFLPIWARIPLFLRLLSPAVMAIAGQWLAAGFDFWGILPLRAILVEHPDLYTWGQLTRGPLVLIGLLAGEWIRLAYPVLRLRLLLASGLLAVSLLLFAWFCWLAWPDLYATLHDIAQNRGKHPPQLLFMLFSMAGAFAVLAMALAGGRLLASLLRPLTLIGTDALMAFTFHIMVIFIGFRYLLGYWHNIPYDYALTLTLCLILVTAIWKKVTVWVRSHT